MVPIYNEDDKSPLEHKESRWRFWTCPFMPQWDQMRLPARIMTTKSSQSLYEQAFFTPFA